MLKKINVANLRMGMHIHELCGPWMDHPFWRTKFVLTDPEDLRRIRETSITEVWIDVAKGLDVEAGESLEEAETAVAEVLIEAAQRTAVPQQASMAEEVKRAAKICAKSREAVVSMFQEVRMGAAISAEAAGAVVDEISSSVLRNPGALISLARLKNADDYTYMHSVAVCALMVALARQMGLNEAETREAGMAGLLHDLGKALIPQEILGKPGKLTDEEFAVIKKHPEEGHRLLVEGGSVVGIPLDVCLHHHEKVDGTGYPHRLNGEQISLHAKMGAVCDVYDAITSNRPYKAGWDPAESNASSRPSSRASASTRSARWCAWSRGASASSSNSRRSRCWRPSSSSSSPPSRWPTSRPKSSTSRVPAAAKKSPAARMPPSGASPIWTASGRRPDIPIDLGHDHQEDPRRAAPPRHVRCRPRLQLDGSPLRPQPLRGEGRRDDTQDRR
jgi:HD-GYP domain-containing protein (c-di-GMP phosphodiesterase class II)